MRCEQSGQAHRRLPVLDMRHNSPTMKVMAAAAVPPLLVSGDAARETARRAAALRAARPGARAVSRCRRPAGGAGRSLLPPLGAPFARQRVRRRPRLRVPRLAVRPQRPVRADAAATRPEARPAAAGEVVPLRGALRLRLGRAGGAALRHPAHPRGRESRVPPGARVLRGLEHRRAARDGERARHGAPELRAPRHLRHARAPGGEGRGDRGVRRRLPLPRAARRGDRAPCAARRQRAPPRLHLVRAVRGAPGHPLPGRARRTSWSTSRCRSPTTARTWCSSA